MKKYRYELIETINIGTGYYPCDAYIDSCGRIAFSTRKPSMIKGERQAFCSNDNGYSWEQISPQDFNFITLQDGSLFSVSGSNQALGEFSSSNKQIPFVAKITISQNLEALLRDNKEEYFAVIDIPDLSSGYGTGIIFIRGQSITESLKCRMVTS